MAVAQILVPVPITPGDGRVDIYSGVARKSGVIWTALCRDQSREQDTVVLIMHPTSNFLGHYALRPLAERGVAAVGVTTRYLGNDSALLIENCLVDIGAVISTYRAMGFERVVLMGNSGGGSLAALYQAEAENPTIRSAPGGGGPDITQANLPPADALVLAMAHAGRAVTLTDWLDPAIEDESNPFRREPSLDMFDPVNGPPYTADFIDRYRQAQVARNRRISSWVLDQLERLKHHSRPQFGSSGVLVTPDDLPFVVHGTAADPRFLDLTLEPSDREATTLWGPPWLANHAPATLGHHTSLHSWLSQWSIDHSKANAAQQLPRVSIPVQLIYGTADTAVFPSHVQQMSGAIRSARSQIVAIKGANHYFIGQQDLAEQMCDSIVQWASL